MSEAAPGTAILGGAGAQPPRSPLAELAARGRWEEVFALGESLMDEDPALGHRALRDVWLGGEVWSLDGKTPGHPLSAYFLASIAWRRGEDLKALTLLSRAARRRWSWLRYYTAEILLRRLNRYALALGEIQRVIKDCPWLWEARTLRAELRLALGAKNPLAGLKRMKVSERAKPAFLAWRGALKLWSGAYRAALPDLDLAASLGNPDALCWRGAAKTRLGRLAEALADLDKILSIDPHDPEALVWRAEARRLAGDAAGSLSDLESILARAPEATWALANRAQLRLDAGDAAGAAEDFARLIPPFFEEAPGGAPGRFIHRVSVTDPKRLKTLLAEIFRLARGCRRSDPHLNASWMRAANIPLDGAPASACGLLYWARAKGLPTPPATSFAAGLPDESAVKAALA